MILEPISLRRANFSFSGEPVSSEKLLTLFKAATLAPSGGNNQPWRYYFGIHGTPGFNALLDCLDDGNQIWAGFTGALVLSSAQIRYIRKGKEFLNSYAWHDTGLANSLLMIQAMAMGLKTHPMGGFDHSKARLAANLDTDVDPVVMIAVGYPGDESLLPPDILARQTSPRNRRPVGEVVTQL